MAYTSYQYFLAIVMVFTGSINTITTKWADRFSAKGTDGVERPFDHPFVQACSMFLGEMLCLVVFKCLFYYYWRKQDGSQDEMPLVKGNRNFNPLVLLPPALCDMVATSVMYIGLNLTYASSFQMLRGAVIVFVGIFSTIFLSRRLKIREWIGIFFVIGGLVVVGLSDVLANDNAPTHNGTTGADSSMTFHLDFTESNETSHNATDVILGDLLIIGAQVIAATQMVWEEKYVSGLDIPPLQAVGWEGLFGFVILGLLQIPFYFIKVPPPFGNNSNSSLEDTPDAFIQMANQKLIMVAVLGTIISIAFFNFAGISVTKEISATTRMVLDSVRTFVIWMFTLTLKWQPFHVLQVYGFIILIFGMCLYNDVLIMQTIYKVNDLLRRAFHAGRNLVGRCCGRSSPDATDDREALVHEQNNQLDDE